MAQNTKQIRWKWVLSTTSTYMLHIQWNVGKVWPYYVFIFIWNWI